MKLHFQIMTLRVAMGLCRVGIAQEAASRLLSKIILRTVRGLRRIADAAKDEEAEKREQQELTDQWIAERDAAPVEKYTVDLTAWKGDDGDPVVELLEVTPEQFSALQHTATAKHLTVETLLGESVRKAVIA